ncbi:MAG: ABC transporter permease [Thermoguttaceae bacterium]|jgi:lipopolysaccharide transport system permease protein|nr:ABC transporter permease [Thermoguttaceae bacterium]
MTDEPARSEILDDEPDAIDESSADAETSPDAEADADADIETQAPAQTPAAAPPAGSNGQMPVIRIRPTHGWRAIDLRELWRYRELLFALTWREIKVRYKQTVLGSAWAIIQPLTTTGLFAALFGVLMGRANMPTVPGVPYIVSTFCAMLPWQLFAHSLSQSGQSLISHQHMITKVYFPRLIIPFSAVLSALVDFGIAFVALVVLMFCYGVAPSWWVFTLPAFVVLAVVSSLAAGLWLSALTAIYRDFRYIVPFIVQLGMFASPVVYSAASLQAKLPDWALLLYSLNPMVGVIEGFRWALLGSASPPGLMFVISSVMTALVMVTGMFYFRRMERTFADVI